VRAATAGAVCAFKMAAEVERRDLSSPLIYSITSNLKPLSPDTARGRHGP